MPWNRYTPEHALEEVRYRASRVLSKSERFLRGNNPRPVAQMLVGIYTEIGRIEKEARRLKLLGSLDYDVYSTLINGYVCLMEATLKLAENYGFGDRVRSLYEFYKSERYKKYRGWDGERR